MELFTQLWHNTDTYDSALARHVLAGRYTWLEEGVIDPSIPGPWIASAEPDHCPARHNGSDRGRLPAPAAVTILRQSRPGRSP